MRTVLEDPPSRSSTAGAPRHPRSSGTGMLAVVQDHYGRADALDTESLPVPTPAADEVLVEVRAAALHQGDWHLVTGEPYLVRAMGFGLRRPKLRVPGMYVAGVVAAVGGDVTELAVGDRVVGTTKRAFAEYATAKATALVALPDAVSFEVAASLPHGGFTALQALRDAARVEPDDEVLVIGAGGAVGLAAVQLATRMGARVTALDGPAKVDLLRSLGAARVLDRTRDDFASEGPRYDAILDMVRDRPDRDYRRALRPGGRCVMVSGGGGRWLGGMGGVVLAALTSLVRREKLVPFLALPKRPDLEELVGRVASGELTVPIDRTFTFSDVRTAFRHLEERHSPGAIVLQPDPRD